MGYLSETPKIDFKRLLYRGRVTGQKSKINRSETKTERQIIQNRDEKWKHMAKMKDAGYKFCAG